jgi:hypothetical protein
MRKRIKRLLREHGYPPDKAAEAVDTVIQQAEQVCRGWGMAAYASLLARPKGL